MGKQLSEKEKRTVKLGLVAVILMGAIMTLPPWWDRVEKVRKSIKSMEADLALAEGTDPKFAGIQKNVPVFAMPQTELKQKFLFREKLAEQLKKAGLKTEPLEADTRSAGKHSLYRRLTLTYKGKAQWTQILDLLANLKTNPYLAAVEEMQIKADPKKEGPQRGELEFILVVSTFVK